ncbi:MAG: ABC transporter ATP-binding protein [Acetobacteraceae bacterium]|nr:ABC transporter ATP-binding protein [Acetobacteraceae bacterium]
MAVDGVRFALGRGETVGLVGESGCGKSVTGLAIMGLLVRNRARVEGSIVFEGQELVGLPEAPMQAIRGRRISMVFQEPMTALDPVFTVGEQIAETLRAHFPLSRRQARERAVDALAQVGIPLPGRRVDDYPHTLSGGMRQRVMIAIALACEPSLLIADEPTTALDVTIQAQIVNLLLRLVSDRGTGLLFISHNIGVVAQCCARMLTMYAGQVIEDGPVDAVLERPLHPYSSGLLRALPHFAPPGTALAAIPGRVPTPEAMPRGCRFAPRCAYERPQCETRVDMTGALPGQHVRCCRWDELALPGSVA